VGKVLASESTTIAIRSKILDQGQMIKKEIEARVAVKRKGKQKWGGRGGSGPRRRA